MTPAAAPAQALRPRPSLFVNAPSAAPTHAPAPAAAPARPSAPVYQATATAPAEPMQVAYAAPAPAPTPAPATHAQAYVSQHSPAAQAMATASATRPATTINWDSLHPAPTAERSLLQRISPVHIGVLMTMVLVMMVVTSGPSAMTAKPVRLPALASGGGGVGLDGMNPRAGATAVEAAAAEGATAAAETAPATAAPAATKAKAKAKAAPKTKARRAKGGGSGAKLIRVGSATLPRSVRAGGIPSPAAGTNLMVAGGGRATADSTASVHMNGIPSAAAGEKIAPETLPYTPDDGVSMARSAGERDAHAVDTHYGAGTLPMEEPAAPAMTPGAAAQQAERLALRNEVIAGANAAAARPNFTPGAPVAY